MEDINERERKTSRSLNFSENEKNHLISIIARYKGIIENKETDKITNEEKNVAWEKIATEFNSTSPATTYRSKDCLKRLYENKKKELRKKVANQKISIKKTGGGPPTQMKFEPFEDVLLSITNKKTVFGLNSLYGGDVSSNEEDNQIEGNILSDRNKEKEKDVEIIYEYDSPKDPPESDLERHVIMESTEESTNWKKYKPSDLSKPVSSQLKRTSQEGTNINVWVQDKDHDVGTSHVPENFPMPSTSKEEFGPTPKRKVLQSDRRRPNIQIKALTSSEVSEKYNKLLDLRLDVANFTKKHLEQEIKNEQEKHEKEMVLMDLKILVEKERLNKMRRSEY